MSLDSRHFLFLYGTLQDPDVFRLVAGHELSGQAAYLPNHAALVAAGEVYPGLAAKEGSRTMGVAAALGDQAMERALYFEEAGVSYELKDVEIFCSGQALKARAFFPTAKLPLTHQDWSLAEWRERHKEPFLRSATLFMKDFVPSGKLFA